MSDLAWNTIRLSIADNEPVRIGITGGAGMVRLVELCLDDGGRSGGSSDQHRNYVAGSRLRYVRHDSTAARLTVMQRDPTTDIEVGTEFTAYSSVVSVISTVRNAGAEPHQLDYVSSLNISGFTGGDISKLRVHIPYNSWLTEFRWRELSTADIGVVTAGLGAGSAASRGRFPVTSTGSWSTGNYLPMGAITEPTSGRTALWQIEHNGAWHWEITDVANDLQVAVAGPTDNEHQFVAVLDPGAAFTTVPVSLTISDAGLTGALADLTEYRRAIRRENPDNENLPVIFNDYMNCLMGDPTTEKLLPLIDAAASVGSEYFVIDAGWYSETDNWWPTVGEWEPSQRRFPGGLKEVMDRIRGRGMVPGLWVEPEVVGVDSPIAGELPASAFFTRGGRRIVENGRYQLDYRHPAVVERMDGVIDRLIADFGVGYFKFDYNINIGVGTEIDADSPGAGLLGHNRAYSAWLDGIFARHPDLVIENCSSGGMRVDYAQLSRHSLQSTSDQQDPLRYVPIAAAAPSAVTPEQSANWAYPQPSYSDELNTLTLVNALLGRVHLSGRIDQLNEAQLANVRNALEAYKGIRGLIRVGSPLWPLGLPGWDDPWVALALRHENETLLAVWRRGGPDSISLELPHLKGAASRIEPVFPAAASDIDWNDGTLHIGLPNPAARLMRLVGQG